MYTPSQLWRGFRRGVQQPSFFGQELNRLYNRRLYRREYNTDGVDVMTEDWDNLIILDACRYDLFSAQQECSGTLERRESRGSHTVEFLMGNFSGRTMTDTVYVTASPQLHRWNDRIDATFHDVINVWKHDWDDTHRTVLPRTMTDYGRRVAAQYPNKRLIVHYMQPHYPFIESPEINVGNRLDGTDKTDIWGQLRNGDTNVSPSEIWEAYRDNLDRVLPAVQELVTTVSGRSVITSDHGNMFGERSRPIPIAEWGHPPGTYTEELVTVPWQIVSASERRDIRSEQPRSSSNRFTPNADLRPDDNAVTIDRLQALGYQE
ncbi:hypothetical protein [Halocatena salina]|uniref:Sulfatase n=1 Tax=Halocatena salina TaxID=2934340 RepID=A0A8U0A283_9EURY|nr:hypothetical protein [Halocatena salina]UPM42899.1 hypothetical protein MW046_00235 [Halocatena salina]